MRLYQQRVYQEHEDLMKRRKKLAIFIESQKFNKLPQEEQGRMLHQSQIMEQYSDVLSERISAFPKD